jgi:hypothetical protein
MVAFLLLVLLVVFPAIAVLPNQEAGVRLAGLSLLWWYGGVLAPLLGGLIAIALAPSSRHE